MIEIASQIVICLLIAAFLGFLIGLFVGRSTSGRAGYSAVPSSTSVKIRGNIYNKPEIRSRPRPSGKDDLKEIDGISADLEDSLNELGVFHFDQLSKWTNKNCDWVEEYLDFEDRGQIKAQRWVSQAQDLASM